MNKLVAFFGIVAISSILAIPLTENAYPTLPADEHEEIHDELGQFALRYVTAGGTEVSERGRLVPSSDGTGYVMMVSYATNNTAGLGGNHAEGNHLPVEPEVPVPITIK